MWLLFIIQLMGSFERSPGEEHETLCTSNACFTLHMDKVTFDQAQLNCTDNGGHLMTVGNRQEEDILRSLLSQIKRQSDGKALSFWIGLRLRKRDCIIRSEPLRGFKWVSEKNNSQYSNWKHEPRATCTVERCVKIEYAFTDRDELKWIPGPCGKKSFYTCMFLFQGMCRPLTLQGPGHMSYTTPFSKTPQKSKLNSFPKGTFSEISCSDQQYHYSVCGEENGSYSWNRPGPFCKAERQQNCQINNGGCEHLCEEDGDAVRCLCKDGYSLDEDGFSCRMRDACGPDTCEYQCDMTSTGFACRCPEGFQLDQNLRTCSDIDECQSQTHTCGSHRCANSPGSYTCTCDEGYEMVDGECRDVDECLQTRCEHNCFNSVGSFSCGCNDGFELSVDRKSCVDINECRNNLCFAEFTCTNTLGSYMCTRQQESDETTAAAPVDTSAEGPRENFTQSLTASEVEVQHPSPDIGTTPSDTANLTNHERHGNTSMTEAQSVKSRVIICVLGSVIPLLVLIAVTLFISVYRCSRTKEEVKKNPTGDGYCWVSSGLDPRLEKLYESIMTDDL